MPYVLYNLLTQLDVLRGGPAQITQARLSSHAGMGVQDYGVLVYTNR